MFLVILIEVQGYSYFIVVERKLPPTSPFPSNLICLPPSLCELTGLPLFMFVCEYIHMFRLYMNGIVYSLIWYFS